MAGGRQDQHLNVTRKIFLALGVINSCVKPSFLGATTGEKRFTIVYPQKVLNK